MSMPEDREVSYLTQDTKTGRADQGRVAAVNRKKSGLRVYKYRTGLGGPGGVGPQKPCQEFELDPKV